MIILCANDQCKMEKAYLPESLEEAEKLVERLSIDDLRVFCSTFGLDSYGTKEELIYIYIYIIYIYIRSSLVFTNYQMM